MLRHYGNVNPPDFIDEDTETEEVEIAQLGDGIRRMAMRIYSHDNLDVSPIPGFVSLSVVDLLGWTVIGCGELSLLKCLAAFLVSMHQMPVASRPSWNKRKHVQIA